MIFQFGSITNPFQTLSPNSDFRLVNSINGGGLIFTINNLLKVWIVISGIYAFWNLMVAGFGFLNAGGDAKAVQKAWDRIWQSILGLTVIAGSFVLAAIFGQLIFGDATILLQPRLFGPSYSPVLQ